MPIATTNPTTGEVLREFESFTESAIETRLQLAQDAFADYRRTPMTDRRGMMHRAADLLEAGKHKYGCIITTEMGKPLQSAVDEVLKCAAVCRYYADHAAAFLADEPVKTEAGKSYICYQPLGPVLAVMPWNFPFWQVFRFVAPALMAGNVGLLKHASNVPQCALAIEEIIKAAGFSTGVLQSLLIGSDQVEKLIDDPRIKAATLTGSERAGSRVASRAGQRIKKTVLELGGSDPFIVMPSCDLEAAVKIGVKARTISNGQSCIAAKRFIVHQDVADEFEWRFVAAMQSLRVGDPFDPSTEIGPLATAEVRDTVESQVGQSVALGARLLTGGSRIGEKGNFYAPTVLTDVPPEAPAYREEVFGPVAVLFRVRDAGEAVTIANDTSFGLGSSVWTNLPDEQAMFINEIEAGQVFVNAMVASDPRLPFGGVKASGFGRELGVLGIREFTNVKTVWINAPQPGSASRAPGSE